MFHRLLVAFDGSPHAQRALTEAIDLAQRNNGRLTVMTLAPEPSAWTLGGGFDVPINLSDLNQQIRQEYETMLDAAIATVPDDLPVTTILKHGAAGPAIVDEAGTGEHDLIVMGSRARRTALTPARERQPSRPSSKSPPRARGPRLARTGVVDDRRSTARTRYLAEALSRSARRSHRRPFSSRPWTPRHGWSVRWAALSVLDAHQVTPRAPHHNGTRRGDTSPYRGPAWRPRRSPRGACAPARRPSPMRVRIPDTVEGAIPRISATLGQGNSRRSAAIVSTRRSSGRNG